MSVRQEDNGRFILDYYEDGRRGRRVRLRLPETVQTLKEAELIEKSLRREIKKPELKLNRIDRIKKLKAEFLSYIGVHRAQSTAEDYHWVFNGALTYFDALKITELNDGHILIYQKRRQQSVANKTINKELSYFSVFLKWAEDKGIRPDKPVRIQRFKYKRPIPKILTYEEVVSFLRVCEPFYLIFFLTTYALGLRISEACKLQWHNIDFNQHMATILGKGDRERNVPIPKWLCQQLLSMYSSRQTDCQWVFESPRNHGKPLSRYVRKAILRARSRAGIEKKITPHLLRHSIATHMLRSGADIETVRRFLGHQDIETTTIYMHVEDEDVKRAASRLKIANFDPVTTFSTNKSKALTTTKRAKPRRSYKST